MAYLLHLETSGPVCSVALSHDDQLLSLRETRGEKVHGALLTRFIHEVLQNEGLEIKQLSAISVSKGPGSYTGLRIGVSVAKGLCYALGVPLIGLSTLEALATRFKEENQELPINSLLVPMIDARRMEVYTASLSADLRMTGPIQALIVQPDSFAPELAKGRVYFFGSGALKCREIIRNPNASFHEGVNPSARFLTSMAWHAFQKGQFEDTAYFEPFYLKDFVATTPRKLQETLGS